MTGAAAMAAACTAVRPQAAVSFSEAGLMPAARPPAVHRLPSRLALATQALLDAIERETGERPVVDPGGESMSIEATRREVRRASQGWLEERNEVAMELIRTLEAGEGTTTTVSRARTALRWEQLVGAGGEVDRRIVDEALRRADEALPPAKVSVADAQGPAEIVLEWPLDPVRVTSPFGVRDDPFGEGTRRHLGIDLAAIEGQTVRATADGTVVFAGRRGGYGLHVEVRHAAGIVSRYAHLQELDVKAGEPIGVGAPVGRAGRSGRATGPHLHFEVWRDGLPIDPTDSLPSTSRFLSRGR